MHRPLELLVAGTHTGVQDKLLQGLQGNHFKAGNQLFAKTLAQQDQRRSRWISHDIEDDLRSLDGRLLESQLLCLGATAHANGRDID